MRIEEAFYCSLLYEPLGVGDVTPHGASLAGAAEGGAPGQPSGTKPPRDLNRSRPPPHPNREIG